MAERMIGLNIDTLFDGDHNHPALRGFIEGFGDAIWAGEGSMPNYLKELGMAHDLHLRLLLGIPEKTLRREERLLAEAWCAYYLGSDFANNPKTWTRKPGWRPVNPGRIPGKIEHSRLDVPWMISIGVPRHTWAAKVFFSKSLLSRSTNPLVSADALPNVRSLLMLSMYGFADPYQFFTAGETTLNAITNPD